MINLDIQDYSYCSKTLEKIKKNIQVYRVAKDKSQKSIAVTNLQCLLYKLLCCGSNNIEGMSLIRYSCNDIYSFAMNTLPKMGIKESTLYDNIRKVAYYISKWSSPGFDKSQVKINSIESAYKILNTFFTNCFITNQNTLECGVNGDIIFLKGFIIILDAGNGRIRQTTKIPKRMLNSFEVDEISFYNWIDVKEVYGDFKPGYLTSNKSLVELAIKKC